MAKRILIWFLLVATSFAAEIVPVLEVNGVRYNDVNFGPVNQGQIVLFHSRGVTTVPIASLPEEYQQRFAAKSSSDAPVVPHVLPAATPQPPPDPAAILQAMRAKRSDVNTTAGGGNNDWATYNHDRAILVVLDGKLVEKATLTPLVGFLVKERAQLSDGTKTYFGAAFDIAERRNNAGKVAPALELRPGLWNRTEERVLLVNYKPETLAGALLKVYVVEVDPVAQWRVFKVGTDPTFEEWKRLSRK